MYEGYGGSASSRDGGGFRRGTSPRHHDDSRDGDYRRSRKDHSRPSGSRATLDYDDNDAYDERGRGDHGENYDGIEDKDVSASRNARYDGDKNGRGSESRQDGSRPRRSYGPPAKAIILGDVPEDATERDILYGLDYVTRDRHMSTDQVKVVRLRHDQNGLRVAFVEFHRRSDAEYFMDRHHPRISFPLEHSRGIDSEPIVLGISFNRNHDETEPVTEPRRDTEDWDCIRCGAINYPSRAFCYKCKLERPEDDGYGPDYSISAGPVLTGETDEDPQQMPSQYLVVRGLEGSVSEQVLANGVMKLFRDASSERTKDTTSSTNKLKSTAPTGGTAGLGAKPGSLRRVFLMRDRRTNESWRYGFAEFATVEDAMGAAAKFRASNRFTIASKPVFVAFIHTGVFVPVFDVDSGAHPNFSFTPIYNPAVRLKYWDERAYPSAHVVSTDPAPAAPSSKTDTNDEANKATSKGALGLKRSKKDKEPLTSAKAIAMTPQMQMWAKKSAELHGVKKKAEADALAAGDNMESSAPVVAKREDLEELQPDGPLNPYWSDEYVSYADWDRVACLLCNWEVPEQQLIEDRGLSQYRREDILIDHEVRVHNHYKDTETKEKAAERLSELGREPRSVTRRVPRLRSAIPPVYISYADFEGLRCHLCRRNFRYAQTIWRHEQESELHKRMLADPKNKERATAELREKGKTPRTMVPDSKTTQQQSRYRDRARERRKAFNQPKQPTKGAAPGEKRKEPITAQAEETPAKKSKGADMMVKMGWNTVKGLGAEGAGRTEAITTEAYAPGVGLGAEGGKLGDASEEAARKTRGNPSDFVEKTRDRARERYEKLEQP